jgi:hypothetical protein
MTEAEQLANWLYANRDKQGTPEFEQKKNQFFAADAAPKAIKVPPRGETAVKILQDEFIKEYERPAGTPEEQSRKEANLGALTRELATLKAQPPAVERQGPAAEEESSTLSSLRQDMGQIEKKRQEQQPEDMRLNAQIAGAAIGAVPGAVQQAAVIRDATGRGVNSGMGRIADLVAQRMQPPGGMSTVADLANDVIGVDPGDVTPEQMKRITTKFYLDNPNEIPNGDRAIGGPGTYAYARRSKLPENLALQATDQKHAARMVANLARGEELAQDLYPNKTWVRSDTSGITIPTEEKEPKYRRTILSTDPEAMTPLPPQQPPQQPRSALPPGQPLTGAPPPRLTAGTNPFQPGTAALFQSPPAEAPMPPMTAGTPPPGMGVRREPTMGAQPGPAMLGPAALGESPRPTSATRGPIRSGLDAVTDMFARNVTEPTQRVLSALPIVTKTLGGMQTLGGGAEALTGARQGDVGKIGTGAAEILGGGLSMFNRTAPAGMAISILTELYRNARTPEDRQKIMDALNERMFGKQEVM